MKFEGCGLTHGSKSRRGMEVVPNPKRVIPSGLSDPLLSTVAFRSSVIGQVIMGQVRV